MASILRRMIVVGLLIASALPVFADPPVEQDAPLQDEPISLAVQPLDQFSQALWPALYSKSYNADCSAVCIPCLEAEGTYEAWLHKCGPSGAEYERVGHVEILTMVPLGRLSHSYSFDAILSENLEQTWSITEQGFAVSGILTSRSTGAWTFFSGIVLRNGIEGVGPSLYSSASTGVVTPMATFADPFDAANSAYAIADGQLPEMALSEPGGGGGEQPTGEPDCEAYNDCVDFFRNMRDIDSSNSVGSFLSTISSIRAEPAPNADKWGTIIGGFGGMAIAGVGLAVCSNPVTLGGAALVVFGYGLPVGSFLGFTTGVIMDHQNDKSDRIIKEFRKLLNKLKELDDEFELNRLECMFLAGIFPEDAWICER